MFENLEFDIKSAQNGFLQLLEIKNKFCEFYQ